MSVDHRFELAQRYLAMGQTNEAIDVLTELLGEDPSDPICHAVLASCLLNMNRLIGAEHELDIAQSLDPNVPLIFLLRSRLQLLQRKLKQARESCDEALRLDPEFVEALLMQANLSTLLSKPDQALERLQQAALIAPNDLDVLIGFGDYQNSQGDHKQALGFANDAMRLNAGSDEANVLLGETLLALGDAEQADHHARYAVLQNPDNESALRLLVNVRARENWFLGLWWRVNSWISDLSSARQALVLIMGFLLFGLAAQAAFDLGYESLSSALRYGWLGLVVYSWVALPIYQRSMTKLLGEFQFNPKF